MVDYLEPFDCEGNKIYSGDEVILVRVTEHLLDNLPIEDKYAINAQVGKVLKLVDFDDYGSAELDFEYRGTDDEVTFHSVWVEPNCLKKVNTP